MVFCAVEIANLELPANARTDAGVDVERAHDPRVRVIALPDNEQFIRNDGFAVMGGLFAVRTDRRVTGGEHGCADAEIRGKDGGRRPINAIADNPRNVNDDRDLLPVNVAGAVALIIADHVRGRHVRVWHESAQLDHAAFRLGAVPEGELEVAIKERAAVPKIAKHDVRVGPATGGVVMAGEADVVAGRDCAADHDVARIRRKFYIKGTAKAAVLLELDGQSAWTGREAWRIEEAEPVAGDVLDGWQRVNAGCGD